ncbi:SH3 domain-containing protein [Amorphus sp. 3PC139-8]|uniref:SH3 domain-containing protein n=1 Tax=Amorphus sp. 3PC139-8 TaxID=2735676 RepID=UPI00345C8531
MKEHAPISLALLLVTAPALADPGTTTTDVHLRSGPGTTYSVIATLSAGQQVDIGACSPGDGWCSVTENGTSGFVSGRYLQQEKDADGWPRSFDTQGGGTITLYQPQVDAWNDFHTLKARIAAEYQTSKDASPVYGVIAVSAKTAADDKSNDVVLSDISVTELNFSALDRDALNALDIDVGKALPTGPITVSKTRLAASLSQSEKLKDVQGLKSDPPPIFQSESPAILVQTNGKPTLAPVEDATGLSFVVNTNWDILQTKGDAAFYLRDGDSWLSAPALSGTWATVDTLPDTFSKLPDNDTWKATRAAIPPKPFSKGTPKVFYSDTPAELIVFDGAPKKEAVPGTSLEWISNTDSDVFFDTKNSTWYVLVSGRWFSAASLDGPWTFATPNLPDDFHNLPAGQPYYSVRYSVPGTSESDEARLKASIPHTARVEVGSVKPTVSYDGDPKFATIDGTSLSYAVNTNSDVIEVADDSYYALENGVWFSAGSATGPFVVADSVPDVIYTIPPSSPVYPATYVSVYDTEPGAVWFGYTAGYLTGLLAWNTYVYGTGWYYPPYWGPGPAAWPAYFARPVTYGIGAYYNPVWGGYGRYGYAYGPYRGIAGGFGYNPATGRYVRAVGVAGPLGEAGFVGAYNPWTGRGGFVAGGRGIYGAWGTAGGIHTGPQWARMRAGVGPNGGAWRWRGPGGGFAARGANGDVFAGRDGNIYRHSANGWERRSGGNWAPVDHHFNQANVDAARNRIRTARADGHLPAHLNHDLRGRQLGNVRSIAAARGFHPPAGGFHGGEFRGGEFRGGEFRGGGFRGGGFHGGGFHGGGFRGGGFRR